MEFIKQFVFLNEKNYCCVFYLFLLKGPFRDPQPHPPFFSKEVEIFTSAKYNVCV